MTPVNCEECAYKALAAQLTRIEDKLDQRLNGHDKRLRSLEGWRSLLAGVWTATCIFGWLAIEGIKARLLR